MVVLVTHLSLGLDRTVWVGPLGGLVSTTLTPHPSTSCIPRSIKGGLTIGNDRKELPVELKLQFRLKYSANMSESSSLRKQKPRSGFGMLFNHAERRADEASRKLDSGVGTMLSGRTGYSRKVRNSRFGSAVHLTTFRGPAPLEKLQPLPYGPQPLPSGPHLIQSLRGHLHIRPYRSPRGLLSKMPLRLLSPQRTWFQVRDILLVLVECIILTLERTSDLKRSLSRNLQGRLSAAPKRLKVSGYPDVVRMILG